MRSCILRLKDIMGIRYQQIRDDRQWRASTGLNKNQFFELVKAFQIT